MLYLICLSCLQNPPGHFSAPLKTELQAAISTRLMTTTSQPPLHIFLRLDQLKHILIKNLRLAKNLHTPLRRNHLLDLLHRHLFRGTRPLMQRQIPRRHIINTLIVRGPR
jgi:hypothetical protein